MDMTINSKKHGEQNFTMRDDGGYVRCNGKQICETGGFMGSTISSTPAAFAKDCRNWWNKQRAELNEYSA